MKGYDVTTDKAGVKTSSALKPRLIEELIVAIRDDSIFNNDRESWSVCMTFVRNPRGRMQAQKKATDPGTKCFGNRVLATALVWRCHLWLPQIKSTFPTPRKKEYDEELAELDRPANKRKSWNDAIL